MVTLYSTPICPNCYVAKEFFKAHGVSYQERDVTKDRSALERMLANSGQMSVPVIEINNEFIVGYDPSRLKKLLMI